MLRSSETSRKACAAIVDDIHAEIGELGDLVTEVSDTATDVRTDEDPAPVELAELAAPIVERQARHTERTIELDAKCDGEELWSSAPQAVLRRSASLVENAAEEGSPDETRSR